MAEVERTPDQAATLTAAISRLRDSGLPVETRLVADTAHGVEAELQERPLREWVTPSPEHPWLVERGRALNGP